MKWESIPQALTDIPRWRLHDAHKRPCNCEGVVSRGEGDLVSFQEAVSAARSLGPDYGIAIEFGGDSHLAGIDLDDCWHDGVMEPWAKEIVQKFGSYTEISQSGRGAKIYFFDERSGHFQQPWVRIGRLEAYIGGIRYFCVTGWGLTGLREPQYAPEAVDWLFSHYSPPKPKLTLKQAPNGPSVASRQNYQQMISRARSYIQAIPGAEEGARDYQLWRVGVICWRMGLDKADIGVLMQEYDARCHPPQADIQRRISHKLGQLDSCRFPHGDLAEYDELTSEQVQLIVDRDQERFNFVRESQLFNGLREKLEGGHFDLESTGIRALDHALSGGMPKHGLVAIVGRPSHGKSALLMHCMRKRAEAGDKCLFISKEMSIDELLVRKIPQVDGSPRSEWPYRADAILGELVSSDGSDNLLLTDSCSDLDDIVQAIRHLTAVEGVNVVAIDYLQRIPVSGVDDDFSRVTKASLTLANLAQELGISMYLACQMNRARETDHRKRDPLMSDIRASGQIEQDMDLILHVEWPALYGGGWRDGLYRISILKSRFMRPDKPVVEIEWDCTKQEFEV